MLSADDKKELKQMMVETFNEGFEAIVLPHIEELKTDVSELKAGQDRLETDATELKDGQARLEDGQEAIARRQEKEQELLDVHDVDIEALKKHTQLTTNR